MQKTLLKLTSIVLAEIFLFNTVFLDPGWAGYCSLLARVRSAEDAKTSAVVAASFGTGDKDKREEVEKIYAQALTAPTGEIPYLYSVPAEYERRITNDERRTSRTSPGKYSISPDLLNRLKSNDENIRREAVSEAGRVYEPLLIRIGEDRYYLIRYFMEQIAGVPFTDVDIDDFRGEAVLIGYELLRDYHNKSSKTTPKVYVGSQLPHRIVRNCFVRKGFSDPTPYVGKLSLVIKEPGEKLDKSVRLSRGQVIYLLHKEMPDFLQLAEEIHRLHALSLESSAAGRQFLDTAEDPAAYLRAEESVQRRMLIERMETVLQTLDPWQREVIKHRYGFYNNREYTQKEIGTLFGGSHSTIGQAEKNAIRRLQGPYRSQMLADFVNYPLEDEGRLALSESGYRRYETTEPAKSCFKEDPADYLPEPVQSASVTKVDLSHWFSTRVPPLQLEIMPYVLNGLSDEEIATVLNTSKDEIADSRRNLLGRLRLWFTLGIFDNIGTTEEIKDRLVYIFSKDHHLHTSPIKSEELDVTIYTLRRTADSDPQLIKRSIKGDIETFFIKLRPSNREVPVLKIDCKYTPPKIIINHVEWHEDSLLFYIGGPLLLPPQIRLTVPKGVKAYDYYREELELEMSVPDDLFYQLEEIVESSEYGLSVPSEAEPVCAALEKLEIYARLERHLIQAAEIECSNLNFYYKVEEDAAAHLAFRQGALRVLSNENIKRILGFIELDLETALEEEERSREETEKLFRRLSSLRRYFNSDLVPLRAALAKVRGKIKDLEIDLEDRTSPVTLNVPPTPFAVKAAGVRLETYKNAWYI